MGPALVIADLSLKGHHRPGFDQDQIRRHAALDARLANNVTTDCHTDKLLSSMRASQIFQTAFAFTLQVR